MRIGVFVGASAADLMSLDELIARIQQAEADGFDSFWVPHISARGYDALTVLALAGTQTSRIELGVGVVPTYPRHPMALAQQALTTATAAGGRFLLGIGPSHRPGIEESFGLSYDRPAQHTREYLSVLRPLIDRGRVQFSGDFYNVNAELDVLDRPNCPVLISALAPRMLRLAGQQADGTITWMAGPRAIRDHVRPRIIAAAESAGRPEPRICVGLARHRLRRRSRRTPRRRRVLRTLRTPGQLPPHPGRRRRGRPLPSGRSRQRSLPPDPAGAIRRSRRHRLHRQHLPHRRPR